MTEEALTYDRVQTFYLTGVGDEYAIFRPYHDTTGTEFRMPLHRWIEKDRPMSTPVKVAG